jgi:hypothetical protein
VSRSALCLFLLVIALSAHSQNIPAPPGSSHFGQSVAVLPNGNIVVVDQFYSPGPAFGVGAVYLYRPNRTLISRLTGTTSNDWIGQGGIVVLPSGNFLVVSGAWDNGSAVDAGAVTFVNGQTGLNGTVSAANSLVGSSTGDRVGSGAIDLLANGNYVIVSTLWDNSGLADAGAVTWGSATQGVSGTISAQNSLVGASAGDRVGNTGSALADSNGVVALANGHYVVSTASWDNGAVADVGAMTWGNGSTGTTGVVSAANSLIGASAGDNIGSVLGEDGSAVPLSNGHYVVASRRWDNGASPDVGAVTWCDGTQPTSAVVSAANSLVGTTADDRVGERVFALTNGHYVVASSNWDAGGFPNVGAVTWRNGSGAFPTTVSTSNSLTGVRIDHRVGNRSVTALTNGHYVLAVNGLDVTSSQLGYGAVIWANGTTGISGPVSSVIGLVGSSPSDFVGSGLYALANGNYVVTSPVWTNGGVAQAGAVTWRDGSGPSSDVVSAANSLVGTTTGDRIGQWGVVPLTNGNYVVTSSDWTNGATIRAGAVSWGNGLGGTSGPVSAANSLVGISPEDQIGAPQTVHALSDGNFIVASPNWDHGGVVDAGAVTWGSGSGGLVGTIDPANSLVGTTTGDRVGNSGVLPLPGGLYAVGSWQWDSGVFVDTGAISLGRAGGSTVGPLTEANSVIGSQIGGVSPNTSWDANHERLAVGRGFAVSFISYESISFDGFE